MHIPKIGVYVIPVPTTKPKKLWEGKNLKVLHSFMCCTPCARSTSRNRSLCEDLHSLNTLIYDAFWGICYLPFLFLTNKRFLSTHSWKPWPSHMCDYQTPNERILNAHKRVHTNGLTFGRKHCPENFKYLMQLLHYIKSGKYQKFKKSDCYWLQCDHHQSIVLILNWIYVFMLIVRLSFCHDWM